MTVATARMTLATATADRTATFPTSADGDPRAPTSVPPRVLDRVFLTDALALGFLATVARWGGPRADRLYSAQRLAEWLALVGLPPLRTPASVAELALLAELRVAVHDLVMARLTGEDPAGAGLVAAAVTVNSAAEAKGYVPLLHPGTFAVAEGEMTVGELRATIAQSCIDVLVGPWSHRLRRCERDPCAHVFLDRSPRGLRRWCTSETCGNVARSRRHRARRATQP